MISVTKIFRFEMGHAIHGYEGMCKYIHGHSYVLHVTVSLSGGFENPISAPGFVIDFKELKKIVNEKVINDLDHSLVLSQDYVNSHEITENGQNLIIWPYEPSAENILIYIKEKLAGTLGEKVKIAKMKLWETSDSFAEWTNNDL